MVKRNSLRTSTGLRAKQFHFKKVGKIEDSYHEFEQSADKLQQQLPLLYISLNAKNIEDIFAFNKIEQPNITRIGKFGQHYSEAPIFRLKKLNHGYHLTL